MDWSKKSITLCQTAKGKLVRKKNGLRLSLESILSGRSAQHSRLLRLMKHSDPEDRLPLPELPQPLPHDCGRANNETCSELAAGMQACQKCCQLDGLAQTHFVSNNAACSLCVKLPEPLHTCADR